MTDNLHRCQPIEISMGETGHTAWWVGERNDGRGRGMEEQKKPVRGNRLEGKERGEAALGQLLTTPASFSNILLGIG